MSVIVQDPEGKMYVYCKGADSAIFPHLTHESNPDTMQEKLEVGYTSLPYYHVLTMLSRNLP